ncbi:hypothetical protein BHM03_00052260 [Ensete ventricosum]|nr:hypothetical protein BHM03_00052260 [Ensete ventricosum]
MYHNTIPSRARYVGVDRYDEPWSKLQTLVLNGLVGKRYLFTKDCNFDLYRPIRAVCTGPPGYWYADRPLSGGTAKIDCRRSIEGEKGEKKKKKKKRKRGRRKKYLVPSSPARRRRPRSRAILLPCEETECLPAWGERSR